eukprot:scaffold8046_cov444-Prasinococcus_capsulatus_cf.AAC.3
MEAVKQGSATVGAQSKDFAVLATLLRTQSELSSTTNKLFKIDDHVGIAMSGLTADGRLLSKFMRNECINHSFVYESPMQVGRLVLEVADKSQVNTHRSWKRPYGVGLLIAGYDKTGTRLTSGERRPEAPAISVRPGCRAHIYQTCPSGNYYQYRAIAIGARSQAAKTYLERTFETFPDATLQELVVHALQAVRETLTSEEELSVKNCSIAIVGKDQKFEIVEGEKLQVYMDKLKEEDGSGEGEAQEPTPTTDAMDTGPTGEAAAEPVPAETEDAAPMES